MNKIIAGGNMKKIVFIFVVLTMACGIIFAADCCAKDLKIAMILWRGMTDAEKGFQEGLKESGYSAQYTYMDAKQSRSRLNTMLAKRLLPRLNEFDYVYSFGTTATQVVKQRNRGVRPHIFNIVADPVRSGIADSMESPGYNISGTSHNISLELQIENALKLRRISTLGFLFNPEETNSNIIKTDMKAIADKYKFNVIYFQSPPADNMLEKNLMQIENETAAIDAVYLPLDSYLISNAENIGSRLRKAGIFSIGAQKEYILKGVLMGLVPDYHKLGKAAANILDRHVKGEKLKDIPVQIDKNPKITINKRTGKVLKISIPEELLQNAVVIE
jgi:ABC-type uncharacterized transport system substrate-binding protein